MYYQAANEFVNGRGYARVAGLKIGNDPLHEVVSQLMEVFADVLPHVPRDGSWGFDHHEPGDPDNGFIIRDKGEHDRKVFFHYRPVVGMLMRGLTMELSVRALIDKLLDLSRRVYAFCIQQSFRFGQALDGKLPGLDLLSTLYENTTSTQDSVLRLLAYESVRPDDAGIMARTHCDRNGWTFALAETAPGLEMASHPDGPYVEESHREGEILIFPGVKLAEQTEDRISATWHRVRYLVEVPFAHGVLRISVVFFVHTYPGPARRLSHR